MTSTQLASSCNLNGTIGDLSIVTSIQSSENEDSPWISKPLSDTTVSDGLKDFQWNFVSIFSSLDNEQVLNDQYIILSFILRSIFNKQNSGGQKQWKGVDFQTRRKWFDGRNEPRRLWVQLEKWGTSVLYCIQWNISWRPGYLQGIFIFVFTINSS